MLTLYLMIGYIVLTIGIALYGKTRSKTVQEYFVAKKSLGVILIVPLLFGELIGGSTTLGNASAGFTTGISSIWASLNMAIGNCLIAFTVLTLYRVLCVKKDIYSIPGIFDFMFGKGSKYVTLVITVAVQTIMFSLQPAAAGSIIAPYLGINTTLATLLMGAVMIILVISGGLEGTAWMNMVHAFVMFFGVLVAACFALRYVGGLGTLTTALPKTYFSLAQPTKWAALAYLLSSVNCLGSATTLSVISGAKSFKTAKRGLIIGPVLVVLYAFCPSIAGMCARATGKEFHVGNVLFEITTLAGGEVVKAILSMAVMAAILSTGTMLLFAGTTTATRDFYKGLYKPNCTPKEELRFGRLCNIVLGCIALYLSLQLKSILSGLLGALQIRSITGIILLVGILWKRVPPKAGFWSLLLGGGGSTVWYVLGNPLGIEPLYPALVLGLGTIIIITLVTTPRDYISASYTEYHRLKKEAIDEGIL